MVDSSGVVVVTGANRGIGFHMAATLVGDGYRVACLDVDGGNVERLRDRAPDRVRFHECDVSETDDVERAVAGTVDGWGRIDVLVNNAAVARFGPFEDGSLEALRREFEVNYFGYVRTIRAALPHLRADGGGVVHNVGSPTGFVGHPGLTGYASTKGAIAGLTRSLRLELRDETVACTLMLPPATDTRMTAELGYPEWLLNDPATVGRKLAREVGSTDRVITPDWQSRVGLFLIRRVPLLWRTATERFVDVDGARSPPD